jgi:sugar (pentulose or hexulose) kinase
MNNYIIAIDVGGSSIKAGIVTDSLYIYEDQIHEFPARSNASSDSIFDNFA